MCSPTVRTVIDPRARRTLLERVETIMGPTHRRSELTHLVLPLLALARTEAVGAAPPGPGLARLAIEPDPLPGLKALLVLLSTSERESKDLLAHAARAHASGALAPLLGAFAELDLAPERVNEQMVGSLVEDVLARWGGVGQGAEHYTPTDVVDLAAALGMPELAPGAHLDVYDPTCGAGGMLAGALRRARALDPGASVALFGQEVNERTWALARAGASARGQDPGAIALGDTLAHDHHQGRAFDLVVSNPPFGLDWSSVAPAVRAERARDGAPGRFAAGLPRTRDGAMLFLQHAWAHLRPASAGGGRAVVVMPTGAATTGAPGSGEDDVRAALIAADAIDAIIALPERLFPSTAVATHLWVLDTAKPAARVGGVTLVDARAAFERAGAGAGRSRRLAPAHVAAIAAACHHRSAEQGGPPSRTVEARDLGRAHVSIARPRRAPGGALLRARNGALVADAGLREVARLAPRADPQQHLASVRAHDEHAWICRVERSHDIDLAELVFAAAPPGDLGALEERAALLRAQVASALARLGQAGADLDRRARDQGWERVQIRHVARVVCGYTPRAEAANWGQGMAWATPTDISAADGELSTTARTLTPAAVRPSALVPAGTVVLSTRAPIGSVAVTTVETVTNQGVKALVATREIDPWCLALQLLAMREELRRAGRGTTFAELGTEALRAVRVRLAPPGVAHEPRWREAVLDLHHARRAAGELVEVERERRGALHAALGALL